MESFVYDSYEYHHRNIVHTCTKIGVDHLHVVQQLTASTCLERERGREREGGTEREGVSLM